MSVVNTAATLPAVTDADFAERVLASDVPVLVDYWATWCPPCRVMPAILTELAADLAGRVRIVTLDLDANPRTARDQRVLAAPTLILYRDGEPVASVVGARSKFALRAAFEPYLAERPIAGPAGSRG